MLQSLSLLLITAVLLHFRLLSFIAIYHLDTLTLSIKSSLELVSPFAIPSPWLWSWLTAPIPS